MKLNNNNDEVHFVLSKKFTFNNNIDIGFIGWLTYFLIHFGVTEIGSEKSQLIF